MEALFLGFARLECLVTLVEKEGLYELRKLRAARATADWSLRSRSLVLHNTN